MSTIYDFYPAHGTVRGIISIPHSGEDIPDVFKEFLSTNMRDLAEDVDFQVFKLLDFDRLNEFGISIMVAKIHRTCVDLNRPPETAVLNWKSNSQGVQIVLNEPDEKTEDSLREKFYTPYFDFLKGLIADVKLEVVPVIDFHSMPSKPTPYHLKQNPNQAMTRPQFCLSDLKGKSCTPEFMAFSVESFEKNKLEAAVNDPYFGGYLTKYINQFNTQNIQIETNRFSYMDETERTLFDDKVEQLKPSVTDAVLSIFEKFSR